MTSNPIKYFSKHTPGTYTQKSEIMDFPTFPAIYMLMHFGSLHMTNHNSRLLENFKNKNNGMYLYWYDARTFRFIQYPSHKCYRQIDRQMWTWDTWRDKSYIYIVYYKSLPFITTILIIYIIRIKTIYRYRQIQISFKIVK